MFMNCPPRLDYGIPPKPQITIIKFKRSRTTYVVPLVLDKKNLLREYFLESLVEAINSSGGLRLVDIDGGEDVPLDEDDGLQVTSPDLELAFPKSKESPYDNEWIPIEDDLSLKTVVLNDYDILAFKFADDEHFRVEQLEYVDEE
ncbi:CIC11C00000003547 [Sungouiella intermedia]|uniref:CIC11C00000003547 n=1 Tax=Sungouiella intermedia TaxID=45354 RepID=A0A1L0BTH4_9ASCO|nr:CIC11C00000003547 [[Candida] intermedia]